MKIGNQKYSELQGNKFYQIIFFVSQPKDYPKWLARVRVIRRDTMEFVKGGFTVYESDKKILRKKIKERVDGTLFPSLEKAGKPSDWNSEIRKILLKCSDVTSRLMRFGSYTSDHLSEQKDEDKYWSKYAQHWQDIIRDTIAVNRMIEKLDEKQRIELLTISDDSLIDPSDAWSLEDIGSRTMVFRFFSCPSKKEKKHHRLQLAKLAKRFKKLGWDQSGSKVRSKLKSVSPLLPPRT